MKIKDVIKMLQKQNQEKELFVQTQDGTDLLKIMGIEQVIMLSGECVGVEIITEQSKANGDYLSPLK